jgi:hypothetical protein
MDTKLRKMEYSRDDNAEWNKLLIEVRFLGITPKEMGKFLEMAQKIDLSKWQDGTKDKTI